VRKKDSGWSGHRCSLGGHLLIGEEVGKLPRTKRDLPNESTKREQHAGTAKARSLAFSTCDHPVTNEH
jgi:hypothetical protein